MEIKDNRNNRNKFYQLAEGEVFTDTDTDNNNIYLKVPTIYTADGSVNCYDLYNNCFSYYSSSIDIIPLRGKIIIE